MSNTTFNTTFNTAFNTTKAAGLTLLMLGVSTAFAGEMPTLNKLDKLDKNANASLQQDKFAPGNICGTDDNAQDWNQLQKENTKQLQNKASFANQLLTKLSAQKKTAVASAVANGIAGRYYIPVVFHVYGDAYNCTTGATCLTEAKIIDGLNKTNEDFTGLNTQDGPIAAEFQAIRDNLNVEFVLAKKDPSGNATNGIVRHTTSGKGYGHDSNADAKIAADAWDNFKYMNVYIMNDLYDDGKTNNSGVAWYPQLSMTQAGLSRVVYNGDYVGTNTNENFRSVLTHEFGHWLNLPHTFDGDTCSVHQEAFCSATGDNACDTPQMSSSILQDNAPNCMGKPTNTENFMHYSDNYAMYTADQVSRMTAALHGAARATLWTNENLIATGLETLTSNADHPWDGVTGLDTAPQGTVLSSFTNLSATKGEVDNFTVDIPAGTEAVAFYLDGFSEDPDMYVSKGSAPTQTGGVWSADYISFRSTGTPELVTITGPSSTDTYHAAVDAFTAYNNATLQVIGVEDPTLCNGCERVFLVEDTKLSGTKGSAAKTYQLQVPADATKTVAVISGGYEGDPDMYVSIDKVPDATTFDCGPFSAPRLSEYCEFGAGGGTVNIMIEPFLDYTDATLRVYYERPADTTPPPPPADVCTVTGNTNYEWIAAVAANGFSHTSAADGGYADNTNLTIPLTTGANTIDLTAGGNYTEAWMAWIDFNADGEFSSDEKVLAPISGKGQVSGSITIPAGFDGTEARMRIVMKYNSEAASPCGTIGDGEAEDYTVSISPSTGGGGGTTTLPDACATQAPITGGRLEAGVPACIGTSDEVWVSLGDVNTHQTIAITTGHGQGDLDIIYKNGGWPSDTSFDAESNGTTTTECIEMAAGSNYWSYLRFNGGASGATVVVDFDATCR